MTSIQDARIGGVIISHGQVANELLVAAEAVVGHLTHIAAVSIGWHDDVEVVSEHIAASIEKVSAGRGVLLLTDMFGGTPTNLAATFLKRGEIELVTGVNLPMVIKLASASLDVDLEDLAKEVEESGKLSINRASPLLEAQRMRKDA